MDRNSRAGCAGTAILLLALAFYPITVRWDGISTVQTHARADRLYVVIRRGTSVWRGSFLWGMVASWAGVFRGRKEREVVHLFRLDATGLQAYQQEQLPKGRLEPVGDELFYVSGSYDSVPPHWRWDGSRFVRLSREESRKLHAQHEAAWEARKAAGSKPPAQDWKRTDLYRSGEYAYRVDGRTYHLTQRVRYRGGGARHTRISLAEPGSGLAEQVLVDVAEFQNRYSLR